MANKAQFLCHASVQITFYKFDIRANSYLCEFRSTPKHNYEKYSYSHCEFIPTVNFDRCLIPSVKFDRCLIPIVDFNRCFIPTVSFDGYLIPTVNFGIFIMFKLSEKIYTLLRYSLIRTMVLVYYTDVGKKNASVTVDTQYCIARNIFKKG